MKKAMLVFISVFVGPVAFASSINLSCSNAGRSIVVSGYGVPDAVTISVHSPDEPNSGKVELVNGENVQIDLKTLKVLGRDSGKNHRTEFSAARIKITPLGNTKLPDAYSRLKSADGSLTDYFVCDHTTSWLF